MLKYGLIVKSVRDGKEREDNAEFSCNPKTIVQELLKPDTIQLLKDGWIITSAKLILLET